MIHAFIYGIILSLGLILPLVMQNLFIFNQGATQKHYFNALPSVLTAFVCDVILIVCAILSVSLIVLTLPLLRHLIQIMGIGFLLFMGCIVWRSQGNSNLHKEPLSYKAQIAFTMSVSLLNPHAILDAVGVIGTSAMQFDGYDKLAYMVACIVVSFIWFLSLSLAGHYFHRVDKTGQGITVVNKISAVVMWTTAIYLCYILLH